MRVGTLDSGFRRNDGKFNVVDFKQHASEL
jgi:hypothetical protein